jgi:hypothetical protein
MVDNTFKLLNKKFNLDNKKIKRFDVHYPFLVNKKKCLKTFKNINWKSSNNRLIFKMIYGNLNYHFNIVKLKDSKLRRKDCDLTY